MQLWTIAMAGATAAAACGPSPTTTGPVGPIANATAPPKLATPEGWIVVDPPDQELLLCANRSSHAWLVSATPAGVAIAEGPRERDTGPKLPFAVVHDRPGHVHTLEVADGFLVAHDGGEWGGDLVWYAKDGAVHVALGEENVHGMHVVGPDQVVVLEGLNHMSIRRGQARWVARGSGTWKNVAVAKLDAGPYVSTLADDGAVYTVTRDSLWRIGRDRSARNVHPMRIPHLLPNTMVVDANGRIWIGLDHFVLRLVPRGDGYVDEWLTRENCRRAHRTDGDCICDGS